MPDIAIESQLQELLVERLFLDIDPLSIDPQADLADYGVDSFMLLELVVAMEETFAVQFEPADITAQALKSLASLADLIRTKQS